MTTSKSTSPISVDQIKVTLEGSEPPIWRRFLVRSDTTLGGLHHVIQAAFGWYDYHLHQFVVGGTYYGETHPKSIDDMLAHLHDFKGGVQRTNRSEGLWRSPGTRIR